MNQFAKIFKCGIALLLCLAMFTACGAPAVDVAPPEPDETYATDDWNNIVAQFGAHTLTSTMFSYFYWSSYTSFLTYHGSDAQNYLDLYTPLDQQPYSEELTWQDYFIEDALMAFKQFCVLNDMASADGFELSETAQNTLANADQELQTTAEGMGFETIDEYLQANYGSGASFETYLDYVHDQFVVREYTAQTQDAFSYTDEEIEAYYDEHAEEYLLNNIDKKDVKMAKLRYMMILPAEQTEENYAELDAVFNEMLADWETWEDKSEEGFMAFGEKWSERGFAQDYLDAIAPDSVYFSYFDDWAFYEERNLGDTRTYYMESGDYFFYYIGQTDEIFWRSQAKYDMCHEAFTAALLDRMATYTYVVHPENIIISEAEDLYVDYSDLIIPED